MNSEPLSDIEIVSGTGEAVQSFKCHKVILAAASELFSRLFEKEDFKIISKFTLPKPVETLFKYTAPPAVKEEVKPGADVKPPAAEAKPEPKEGEAKPVEGKADSIEAKKEPAAGPPLTVDPVKIVIKYIYSNQVSLTNDW
jgi:hypothetical protein